MSTSSSSELDITGEGGNNVEKSSEDIIPQDQIEERSGDMRGTRSSPVLGSQQQPSLSGGEGPFSAGPDDSSASPRMLAGTSGSISISSFGAGSSGTLGVGRVVEEPCLLPSMSGEPQPSTSGMGRPDIAGPSGSSAPLRKSARIAESRRKTTSSSVGAGTSGARRAHEPQPSTSRGNRSSYAAASMQLRRSVRIAEMQKSGSSTSVNSENSGRSGVKHRVGIAQRTASVLPYLWGESKPSTSSRGRRYINTGFSSEYSTPPKPAKTHKRGQHSSSSSSSSSVGVDIYRRSGDEQAESESSLQPGLSSKQPLSLQSKKKRPHTTPSNESQEQPAKKLAKTDDSNKSTSSSSYKTARSGSSSSMQTQQDTSVIGIEPLPGTSFGSGGYFNPCSDDSPAPPAKSAKVGDTGSGLSRSSASTITGSLHEDPCAQTFTGSLMCRACRGTQMEIDNHFLECVNCQSLLHQQCASPPVSVEAYRPGLVWYCQSCTEASESSEILVIDSPDVEREPSNMQVDLSHTLSEHSEMQVETADEQNESSSDILSLPLTQHWPKSESSDNEENE